MSQDTHFEDLEREYQEEHKSEPYNKQAYAIKMHERELGEMSEASSHMTVAERRAKRNREMYGHGWDFLAYCKEYAEKMRAHEETKRAIS